MQMKKIFSLILCLSLLLAGCARIDGIPEESGKASGETSYATEFTTTNILERDPEFILDEYFGLSSAELAGECDRMIYSNDMASANKFGMITPTLAMFNEYDFAYSKPSGRFMSLCRDPLCDHQNERCILGFFISSRYWFEDRVYYISEEWTGVGDGDEIPRQYRILSYDLYLDDCRDIYLSEDPISNLKAEGDNVYFVKQSADPETDEKMISLCRIPKFGGKEQVILRRVGDDAAIYYFPVGDGEIMFCTDEQAIKTYDMSTGETADLNVFGCEAVLWSYYGGYVYCSTDGGDYKFKKDDPAEIVPVTDLRPLFGPDGRVYYTKTELDHIYGEKWQYYKYELYSSNEDGSDERFEMDFKTDGINDELLHIHIRGNLMVLEYRKYTDHENGYNPGGISRGTHWAIVDLSSGKRFDWAYVRPMYRD